MEMQELEAQTRSERGKGAARELRRRELIPAVFYGRGVATMALAVAPKELTRALTTSYRRNVVLRLKADGQERTVMVKEVQDDPVTGRLLHVDFYEVSDERTVEVDVPLTTSGRAQGVVKGGQLTVVYRTLPVHTVPSKILDKIEVDVTPLDIGQTFCVKDLDLPEGVQVTLSPSATLISVQVDKRRKDAADEDEDQAEAAAS